MLRGARNTLGTYNRLVSRLPMNSQMKISELVWRLFLTYVGVTSMHVPVKAHEIGFGDQLLQPVTLFHCLLPLLAVGLLSRQQKSVQINRLVALMLSLGLVIGLCLKVYLDLSQSQLIFAPIIAVFAGSLVAIARPISEGAHCLLFALLGIAIGANLSLDTTDWIDFAQTLLAAFIGSITVLYVMATTAVPATGDWHRVGLRAVGSWVFACAIMVIALEVRKLT